MEMKENNLSAELETEGRTIRVMVEIYCRDHHDCQSPPCADCCELVDYAIAKVKKCPLQEKRTTCGKCEIHCYQPAMKKMIKEVMRYSGPRMLKTHPLLTARHMLKAMSKE